MGSLARAAILFAGSAAAAAIIARIM